MDADRRSALLTGTFYILGTVLGMAGLLGALGPVLGATDYLRAFGMMETRVLVASLLTLLMCISLVAMSVAVYPVLRRFNPGAAIAYFGARIVEAVTTILVVMSWLALAQMGTEYVKSGAADASRFQPLGSVLLGVGDWAGHGILDVAIFPLGALVLYWVLFRARLVPRWLSVWGLVGAVAYWAAGVLVMFHVLTPMTTPHVLLQAPLGLQEMVLAVWLIAKGFSKPALARLAPATGLAA